MKMKWLAALVLAPSLALAEAKIGVIDPLAALESSNAVQSQMASLEAELKSDQDRLEVLKLEVMSLQQKAQTEGLTMSEDEKSDLQTQGQQKMIEIENLQRKLQRRLAETRRGLLEQMSPKLSEAVEAVATEKGLDVVVNAQAIIYVKPDLDITQAVSDQLNAAK